jgi:hypothetical protein
MPGLLFVSCRCLFLLLFVLAVILRVCDFIGFAGIEAEEGCVFCRAWRKAGVVAFGARGM